MFLGNILLSNNFLSAPKCYKAESAGCQLVLTCVNKQSGGIFQDAWGADWKIVSEQETAGLKTPALSRKFGTNREHLRRMTAVTALMSETQARVIVQVQIWRVNSKESVETTYRNLGDRCQNQTSVQRESLLLLLRRLSLRVSSRKKCFLVGDSNLRLIF